MRRKVYICPKCGLKIEGEIHTGEKLVCPRCNVEMRVIEKALENQSIFRNYKNIIFVSIITLLIIASVAFVIIPVLKGETHFLIVLSGSMEPTIRRGDIVVSAKVDVSTLKEGDIITFRYTGEKNCITHRISKVLKTEYGIYFETKGDANEDKDTRLARDDEVIGKVTFVIPYLGYLPAFARTTLGWIILVVIPGILIIINEILKIRVELVRRRLSR